MNWLQKFLGVDVLMESVSGVVEVEQEVLTALNTQNERLLDLQNKVDTLIRVTALNTKSVQSIAKSFDGQIEENEIEKELDDAIDLTDGQRVPIVQGMKVRFETEGVDTEIGIS